jgi:hypothetical protein
MPLTLPRIHREWAGTSSQGRSTDPSLDASENLSSAGSLQELSQQLAAVQRNYTSLSLVIQCKQDELVQVIADSLTACPLT